MIVYAPLRGPRLTCSSSWSRPDSSIRFSPPSDETCCRQAGRRRARLLPTDVGKLRARLRQPLAQAVQPRQPQPEVERQPVLAGLQPRAGDLLDPVEAVVERRAVQA